LLEGRQDAGDELDGDVAFLTVGHIDEGLGGLAVDELDAEDVSLGEGGFEIGEERGGCGGRVEGDISLIDDRGNLRG